MEHDRIDTIRGGLQDRMTALGRARRKPANRAEVAVLEGAIGRLERAVKTLEGLTALMGADFTPSSHELQGQYDTTHEQIRKGLAEVDAGLVRLETRSVKAGREPAVPKFDHAARAHWARHRGASHTPSSKWAVVLIGGLVLALLMALKAVLAGR